MTFIFFFSCPAPPTCCMEVDISAMMVVAALRMVEVVGEAGRPRQMSWYLGGKIFTRF